MKPNLIFIHGGPGFKDYLEPYFDTFKESFTTVFYDQIQKADMTIDELIQQLDAIVESQSGPVILLGHSWGGVLAVEYALRFQDKLSGVVIMSTGLCFKHWNDDFKKHKEELGLTHAAPEDIFLTRNERPFGIEFLNKTWEGFSGETFDYLYENYIKSFDLTSKLKDLKIPLMNIYGDEDNRFPVHVARSLQKYNENMSNIEIPDAGHFPFLTERGQEIILNALRSKFSW